MKRKIVTITLKVDQMEIPVEYLEPTSLLEMRRLSRIHAANGMEVCGALIRNHDHRLSLKPMENLSTEVSQWSVSVDDILSLRQDSLRQGKRLVGLYHSHVRGFACPSIPDLEDSEYNALMMIYDVMDDCIGLWRPVLINDKNRLRPVAAVCGELGWDEEYALCHARVLYRIFKQRKRRFFAEDMIE